MALKFLVNSYKIIQNPLLNCYNPVLTKAIRSDLLSKKRHFFAAENIEEVPEVIVDQGKFKFLLINLTHAEIQRKRGCKAIVRGFKAYKSHGELFNAIKKELNEYNLLPESAGGGIIFRNPEKKQIHIYGTSMKYGRADFRKVARLLKYRFPFYKITFECDVEDDVTDDHICNQAHFK